MATTKKTTTKSKTTVDEQELNEIISENSDHAVEEEIVKTEMVKPMPVKENKVFTDSDYILCSSVWSGGLNVSSQSGNIYRFEDYGSECDINYRDLVTLIRRGSDHVFLPRFIILDEDFLKDFPTVQRVYGEMYTMKDLTDILELPLAQMKREIEKLPKATKDNMRNLIATQIANGKLDSISKVRTLSELFNSDFNLLSELFVK